MALFDFMKKKKEPTHETKIQAVYEMGFKEPFNKLLFPNGAKQVDKLICSLAEIIGVSLDSCGLAQYLHIAQLYSEVYVRHVMSQSTNNQIISSLQIKHPDLVKDTATARKIMVYSLLHMNNHDFSLNSTDNANEFRAMVDLIIENERTASLNENAAKRHLVDADYGLTETKPVYAEGAAGINKYLASLVTTSGEELAWNRVGVMEVPGINGVVDIYESKLTSGKEYKKIFFNLYSNTTSTVIPAGFARKPGERIK